MSPEIRSIIADDELLAREKLRILLESEGGVHVLAECRDGSQTIAALQELQPDLVFLDVQMPPTDGFQVLRSIPHERMPLVIFTTAYDGYAIRAFEEQALDYLLKPFDQQRLHRAIERTRAELLKLHDGLLARQMVQLFGTAAPKPRSERLVIKTGGRVLFLDTNEIDWIEAAANYVRVHAGKESLLVRENIGTLCQRLDSGNFLRIHRSIITNVSKIKELQPCNSGEYIVILKDGKELPCSRSYRTQLLQFIEHQNLTL